MNENWVGKVVSIKCVDKLGVFQGTITEVNLTTIKIGNAFRNGLPMKSAVVINAADILQLDVIAAFTLDEIETNNNNNSNNTTTNNNNTNTININNSESNGKIQRTNNADDNTNGGFYTQAAESINNNSSGLSNRIKNMKINMKGNTNVNSSPNATNREHHQQQPPPLNQVSVTKTEIRLATSAPTSSFMSMLMMNNKNTSNPIEIQSQKISSNNNHNNGNHNNNNNNGNNNHNYNNNNGMPSLSVMRNSDKKKNYSRRNAYTNNQAFATSCEDPTLDEDFDFEKNLALFDKQAIWEEIDSAHKPDLVRQTPSQRNYRHDENILASNPTRYRQITTEQTSDEYTTDDGLVIPSISASLRYLLQSEAESHGLIWSRQCDMLARGTTEIAISILGGARRLIPKNQHQWPTIVIICDRPDSDRQSEVGLNTGRILSSHGLKTYVVVKPTTVQTNSNSNELELYKATGNVVIQNPMTELPSSPDLIILSISGHSLRDDINTWITDIRSPIIAVDPPVVGIKNIQLKLSILPILPLDGMNKACGKLYLCNLGIPDLYFQNAGIKYKSPFGHKFVIPLHDM